MGWYISPKVGGDYVCGVGNCKHRDCEANRRLIAAPCTVCGNPLGEGVRFYFKDASADIVTHATCEEFKVEVKK